MAAAGTFCMLGPACFFPSQLSYMYYLSEAEDRPCPGYEEAGAPDSVAAASPPNAFVPKASWHSCVPRAGDSTG